MALSYCYLRLLHERQTVSQTWQESRGEHCNREKEEECSQHFEDGSLNNKLKASEYRLIKLNGGIRQK